MMPDNKLGEVAAEVVEENEDMNEGATPNGVAPAFVAIDNDIMSKAVGDVASGGTDSLWNHIKHKARELWQTPTAVLVYSVLSMLYLELVFHLAEFNSLSPETCFALMFGMVAGFIIAFLSTLSTNRRVNRNILRCLLLVICAVFAAQIVYKGAFDTFLALFGMLNVANQAFDWMGVIWVVISKHLLTVLAMFVPFACIFFIPKEACGRAGWKHSALAVSSAVILYVIAVLCLPLTGTHERSAYDLHNSSISIDLSVEKLGVTESMILNARDTVFGRRAANSDFSAEKDEGGTSAAPTPENSNMMNIDFAAIDALAQDELVSSLSAYFQQQTPTRKNEYTGMFEGKNLILITAEGWSPAAVSETLTPTLWKLIHSGFVFENYYSPLFYGSTCGGEYGNMTGLIPTDGEVSLKRSGEWGSNLYFTLSKQLLKRNYKVTAYHNGTNTYYGRNLSFPNMGFEWIADGSGYEPEVSESGNKPFPQSDLYMMQQTVPQFVTSEPFYTYYMTISGHEEYTFNDNMMSYRHMDEVAGLPYSEDAQAYIAANLELDLAMKSLLEQLETAGTLDNTVIALACDHIPYLYPQIMDEIAGRELERTFELYENYFILYNSQMEAPVVVKRPCESLDITPTLFNLFGVEYDSRMIAGRDALSSEAPLVIFADYSWISDRGRYYADSDIFVPAEGVTLAGAEGADEAPVGITVDQAYIDMVNAQVRNRFDVSTATLESNYYEYLQQVVGY